MEVSIDLPVLDCRHRGAVAQVAGDDVGVRRVALEELHRAPGHVAVARAVEPVAADLVLLVQLVGQPVQVRGGGHRLVEGGIEDRHLLGRRQDSLGLADADEVRRVVQGSELHVLLDRPGDVIVDDHRGGVLLPAVNHAVTHARDLRKVRQDSLFRVRERFADELHGRLVVGDLDLARVVAPCGLLGDPAFQLPDALHEPSTEARPLRHPPDLVLQRGAAAVDDQYFPCSRGHWRTFSL